MMLESRPLAIRERFFAKVNKNGPTVRPGLGPCWLWTAVKGKNGYGRMSFHVDGRARTVSAHRISWELSNGAAPEGMFVLHRCDNRPCVNPGHLFLGTTGDNMDDKRRKGRWQGRRGVFIGVSPRRSKWGARLWHLGKQVYLGDHASQVTAALVYDRAARDLYGSDTPTNFAVSAATETAIGFSFRLAQRSASQEGRP